VLVVALVSTVILGGYCAGSAETDASIPARYDKLLHHYVVAGAVDYAALKPQRSGLDQYLADLARITQEQFNSWPSNAKLAYLINLYNATTLELILDHYPVSSIKDIGSFFSGPWDQPVVNLFGQRITLNKLEHGIIRPQFNEPLVHLALVCAAKGCPPLRSEVYYGATLDLQLEDQARTYLATAYGMRFDLDDKRIYLSKIFKWYKSDFPSVLDFVSAYAPAPIADLDSLTIKYLDYDWSLNEVIK
jgi:hypothetical protein